MTKSIMQLRNIFAIPAFESFIKLNDNEKKELADIILEEYNKDPYGTMDENAGGWKSEIFRAKDNDNPILQMLFTLLNKEINLGIASIAGTVQHEVDRYWYYLDSSDDFYLDKTYTYEESLVGIFSINLNKNDYPSSVVLIDDNVMRVKGLTYLFNPEDKKDYMKLNHVHHFTKNNLIIFPEFVTHKLSKNIRDQDRIFFCFRTKAIE